MEQDLLVLILAVLFLGSTSGFITAVLRAADAEGSEPRGRAYRESIPYFKDWVDDGPG